MSDSRKKRLGFSVCLGRADWITGNYFINPRTLPCLNWLPRVISMDPGASFPHENWLYRIFGHATVFEWWKSDIEDCYCPV